MIISTMIVCVVVAVIANAVIKAVKEIKLKKMDLIDSSADDTGAFWRCSHCGSTLWPSPTDGCDMPKVKPVKEEGDG